MRRLVVERRLRRPPHSFLYRISTGWLSVGPLFHGIEAPEVYRTRERKKSTSPNPLYGIGSPVLCRIIRVGQSIGVMTHGRLGSVVIWSITGRIIYLGFRGYDSRAKGIYRMCRQTWRNPWMRWNRKVMSAVPVVHWLLYHGGCVELVREVSGLSTICSISIKNRRGLAGVGIRPGPKGWRQMIG